METINEILDVVWRFWPFLMFVVVTSIIAQILKKQILTKSMAKRYKTVFWFRRLLPLILIGIGAIVGSVWQGDPTPGVSASIHKMLYFMGAACVSIAAFSTFKNWIKKKHDIDLAVGDD